MDTIERITNLISSNTSLLNDWQSLKRLLENMGGRLSVLQINLVNIIVCTNLFDEIDNPNVKNVQYLRYYYGMDEEAAKWCVELLNSVNIALNGQKKHEHVIKDLEYLKLENYNDNDKIPESFIIRVEKAERKYGISDINCSVRKVESWSDDLNEIKISGEVTLGKNSNTLLIHLMVYNDDDKLIAYNADNNIYKNEKSSIFDEQLMIPKNEKISAIYLRVGLDPFSN